jgi:RNA polymerase sigma-70 factor, ECF subfamily
MSSGLRRGFLNILTSEPVSEDELVRRAQKDPAQFGQLYDCYIQRVYRFLLARTANTADAEDLTSQTFLTAVEKINEYHPDGHFGAWLFRIALNKQIDLYRKRKGQADTELNENLSDQGGDLLGHLIQDERQSALRCHIAALSDKERELIQLRLAGRMSFSEMGAYLNQNSEAVKKSYYRIVQRLKAEMEVDHE